MAVVVERRRVEYLVLEGSADVLLAESDGVVVLPLDQVACRVVVDTE